MNVNAENVLPWQLTALEHLNQFATLQRIPHALLVYGIEGLGQVQLLTHWAASLLCVNESTRPCGNCRQCELFQHQHPDYCLVSPEEAGKAIKIDQIRALQDFVVQTPLVARCRVILITSADALNLAAANALLKILEEPPINTYWLLAASNPELIPMTIRSRCQALKINAPQEELGRQWLSQNIDANLGFTDEQLGIGLRLANFAPLEAKRFLQDPDAMDKLKKLKPAFENLGLGLDELMKFFGLIQNLSLNHLTRFFLYWLHDKTLAEFQGSKSVKKIQDYFAWWDAWADLQRQLHLYPQLNTEYLLLGLLLSWQNLNAKSRHT